MSSGVGRYKANCVLQDIKGTLETLAAAGEEIRIHKATLHIQLRSATANCEGIFHTVGMVSDGAIAAADPGDNNPSDTVDDALDVLTAGEYESQILSELAFKENIASGVYYASQRIDVTSFVRRTSEMLARSAMLSTNPASALVGLILVRTTNPTIYYVASLTFEYTLVPKPLRMLR